MLNYIVPQGKNTAVVKYLNNTEKFISQGYDLINFPQYQLVILQNS
jgi:hypothetical protein